MKWSCSPFKYKNFKVSSTLMSHTWQLQKTDRNLSAFEPSSQEPPEIKECEKISAKGEINLSYYID